MDMQLRGKLSPKLTLHERINMKRSLWNKWKGWHTGVFWIPLDFIRPDTCPMETRFGTSRFDPLSSQSMPASKGGRAAQALQAMPEAALVFDACHVGVILRTVLTVELLMAVGAMFVSQDVISWFTLLAIITGAALPAALLWLIVACSLKKQLQKLTRLGQWMSGMALGGMAGLYGCGILVWIGFISDAPWIASALTGMLIAAGLVAVLIWRAQQRSPAGAAARLTELQSRIRPHFLFNTLNSAIALVRAEPAKAEMLLEDLSELFRSALVDQGEVVSLKQEIDLAKRYLAIEEVRFGHRLRVNWAIDPSCLKAKLPPLLLQPLVENAVKHGVEPSSEGAEVKISAQRRAGAIVIKITNTAPGGQGQAGHGLALQNVQDRLRLLHDVQASFRCTWIDGIYQVRMEIPA
jgi:two-component system sensor histidine kinase AlgZ